jgi:hypothetical protein
MKTISARFVPFSKWEFGFLVEFLTVFLGLAGLLASAQAQDFSDDFARGTDPGPLTPWVAQSGVWTVSGGQLTGGINANFSYGFAYITNTWSDYSVQARIRLQSGAFGAGLGGRLNPVTGAHYAAWVYPEDSTGGSNVLKLIKFQTWTTFGYTNTSFVPMAQADLPTVGTDFHSLRMVFRGPQITVFYDSQPVITITDVEENPYQSGAVSIDMWTDSAQYLVNVDDVSAKSLAPVARDDSYSLTTGTTLTVASPGVLGNDSGGQGPLSAVLVAGPSHGSFDLSTNGAFSYTPTNGYTGSDSFTYSASDGLTNSDPATVNITVVQNDPPIASDDRFDAVVDRALTIAAPGVLANDTDPNGNSLTAVLAVAPAHGTLSLNANGGFSYTPDPNYSGTDTFVYRDFDGLTNSNPATVNISVRPAGVLFSDGFTRATEPGFLAPWIPQSGNWTVTAGALVAGANPLDGYASVYVGDNWRDYVVRGRIRFDVGAFGGGVGGRLNTANGARYSAWIYPEDSLGGSNVLKLIKFQNWTSFGYGGSAGAVMGEVSLPAVGTNWHNLAVAFQGQQIGVYFDGNRLLSAIDVEAQTYSSGGISFDLWTDATPYIMSVDDVVVSHLAVDDSYVMDQGTTLTVAAPGLLGNDTAIFGTSLTAVVVSGPTNGTLQLSADGGFTFTPATNFTGADSFTYRADDSPADLGVASVMIIVNPAGPSRRVFFEGFDQVGAPGLPIGWTTTASGAQSPWLTQAAFSDSAPNVAFSSDADSIGLNELVSPSISLPAGQAQLTFRSSYNLESGSGTSALDGGVLELKIGGGEFRDILDAGGTFLSGGYGSIITTQSGNPLAGRQAWSGNSGGFVTTTVNLPDAAAGQTIQLRWRCGSDQSNGSTGWSIDTVAISNCTCSCCWNTAPTLPVQTDRTVIEMATLSVTNTATDGDLPPNLLTYSFLTAPTNAIISSEGIISWTPDEAQGPSTNVFTTVVSDGGLPPLRATNSFTVVVLEVNSPPILPAQADRTIAELTTLIVTNSGSDLDLPPNTLTYSLINPPAGASIDNNGVITWSPNEAQGPSVNTFQTVVTDNGVPPLSATNSFTVVVTEVNIAPVLPPQSDRTISELTTLVLTNRASDADLPLNTLSYTLNGPVGATINSDGTIIWTPTEAQGPSTNRFETIVSDNALPPLSATNVFIVVVTEVNSSPVLPPQTDLTIAELTALRITNTASDTDIPANNLSYSLEGPAGATINPQGIIIWTPSEAQGPSTNHFVTIATDDGVPPLSATNSFTVVVTEVNSAPVLPVQADRTMDELTTMIVTNTGSDADIPANTLSYALLNPPLGATIDTNGVITWTPSEAQGPSTNTLVTVVTDNGAPPLSTTNSFVVVVLEVNSPPVLPVQADRTISELTLLVVTNTASDGDNFANTSSYVLRGPAGASIDGNGVITWTPTESQGPSTNLFETVATDNGVPPLSATNKFTVVVTEVNSPPVLTAQADRTTAELTMLVVTNSASDSDIPVNSLAYTLNGPAGAVIDINGIITWTPTEVQGPSTNTFQTVVTDSGAPPLSATNSFVVVVTEVNSAPVLPTQNDRTIGEMIPFVATNTASDSDLPANALTYVLNGPAGAAIDGNGIITWTPTESQGPGTNTFETVVVDNGVPPLSATNKFTVVVTEVNSPPVLSAQTDRTLAELTSLVVTNTASDSDLPANSLSYGLNGPAGAAIDGNGVITWSPGESQGPSTNIFETVVTDNGVPPLSTTNRFTVVVTEVNSPPVLTPQADRTVAELTSLVVTNTASDPDLPANNLSYALINPPAGAAIDAHGVITWIPSEAQGPGTNLIVTVATDDGLPVLSVTNSFKVVVTEVNSAPVLAVLPDRTITALTTLVVTNQAIDSDLPQNTLTYSFMLAPAGAVIDTNGVITWTPTEAQASTTNRIRTLVTDNGIPSLSAINTFRVIVTPAPPQFRITSNVRANGIDTITWNSISNQTYRLQFKDNLNDIDWQSVFPDANATSGITSATNAAGNSSQRFYRVMRLP